MDSGRSLDSGGSFHRPLEDLSDDLICLILDKLSTSERSQVPGSFQALASFASVSAHYGRLVRDTVWEGACRKALPVVCTALAPVGGRKKSPGDVGWLSFAKLLTWCPGNGRTEAISVPETDSAVGRCRGITANVRPHMYRRKEDVARCVFPDTVFKYGSHCATSVMFCCRVHRNVKDGWIDVTRMYRGIMDSPEEWGLNYGINLSELRERARFNDTTAPSDESTRCPFCPALMHMIPEEALRWTSREDDFMQATFCTNGHFRVIHKYRLSSKLVSA